MFLRHEKQQSLDQLLWWHFCTQVCGIDHQRIINDVAVGPFWIVWCGITMMFCKSQCIWFSRPICSFGHCLICISWSTVICCHKSSIMLVYAVYLLLSMRIYLIDSKSTLWTKSLFIVRIVPVDGLAPSCGESNWLCNKFLYTDIPLRHSVLRRCWQDEHRILTIIAQQGICGQWLGAMTHEDAGWPAPAWAPGLTQRESYLILRKTIPLQKLWRGIVLSGSG